MPRAHPLVRDTAFGANLVGLLASRGRFGSLVRQNVRVRAHLRGVLPPRLACRPRRHRIVIKLQPPIALSFAYSRVTDVVAAPQTLPDVLRDSAKIASVSSAQFPAAGAPIPSGYAPKSFETQNASTYAPFTILRRLATRIVNNAQSQEKWAVSHLICIWAALAGILLEFLSGELRMRDAFNRPEFVSKLIAGVPAS